MTDPVTSAVNIADLERMGEAAMDPGAHGYFAGGAGDEVTLRENVSAFNGWRIRPRVLVDVSEASPATTVLGTDISMPVVVAPVAFQRLAHPDGEEGMARATAAAGTIMSLSSLATARPADVAAAAPGSPRWFQLYCFSDRAATGALLDEAAASGYSAILLTVDAPRAGRRERDFRTGFSVPPEVTVPSVQAATGSTKPMTPAEIFALVDPSLDWDDLAELVEGCALPVILKGLMTEEDARLAVDAGAAGVVVSNHGGRQLDRVQATIDALPEVAEAVDGRIEVLMDGGIRRGTDVITALALGAKAVLVGRPALWGLAAGGEAGARHALQLLHDEVALGLILAGCPTPDHVTRAHVQRAGQPR
ncbi:MAG: 4-hydroxymandelate oxidase [Thermoleophilaceae bacterium]|nr:4-hydroxymandelate oxidase [Thermoleophilaceae bacterium]